MTNRDSFDNLEYWISELKEKGDHNIKILLLGNKIDLDDQREINFDKGKQLAEEKGIFFMEVSAKDNKDQCVHKAFFLLMEQIIIIKKKEEEL